MGVGTSLQSMAIDTCCDGGGGQALKILGCTFSPEFSCFEEATKSDCICGFLLTAHLRAQLISGCWRSYSKISFFDDLTRLVGKIVPLP